MTEGEAQAWIAAQFGPAAVDRLSHYASLLVDENSRQNLVAPSTIPVLWTRHLLDSAQLAQWGRADGVWLDVGTGGGVPGLVLALLLDRPFCLVEPRRLRAAFLSQAADTLGVAPRVEVRAARVEAIQVAAATISARAVAGLDRLITSAQHCATRETIWVLPRGQSGVAELQASLMPRRAEFHVKQSLSDPTATVLVGKGIGA